MKIFLAQAVGRSYDFPHAQCLFKLLQDNPNIKYEAVSNDALVSRSRSIAATRFLKSDCDILLTIDTDILFDEQQVYKICEQAMDYDIVSGVYHTRDQHNSHGTCFPIDNPKSIGSLLEVKWAPTGFLATHRRVIEQLKRRRDMHLCVGRLPNDDFYPFYQPLQFKTDRWHYLSEDWSFPVVLDTPVLGANWQWKCINEFSIGDYVMSVDEFSPLHSSRRYRSAVVTDTIYKYLPILRIVTEENEIYTTEEHPWLTKRMGRKNVGYHATDHVASPQTWVWTKTAEIKKNDMLAAVVPNQKTYSTDTNEYMIGYAQGIFHSDGTLSRDNRNGSLRMKDPEAILRTKKYFDALGIYSHLLPIHHSINIKHASMYGLGVYRKESAEKLSSLILYDPLETIEFARGYLAGFYDGDGCYDGGVITISNTSEALKHRIIHAGHILGLNFNNFERYVRLSGGTDAIIKFWMLTNPAISRKTIPTGQLGSDHMRDNKEVKHTPVRVLAVEKTGDIKEVMCLTTTTGTFIASTFASHNCERARQEGFQVWLDKDVEVGHMGLYTY